MKTQNIYKPDEDMMTNISTVLFNIGASITAVLSTIYGKLLTLILFIGAYFTSISGLIHTILILTMIDAIFGIRVSMKMYGKNSILSSKLRQTLYKIFFYLMFIILSFMIECQLAEDSIITAKIIFAIMAGVELWSIAANGLILHPNFPFLRLFSKYLSSEIGKKLSISSEEVDKILKAEQKKEKRENNKTDESSGSE